MHRKPELNLKPKFITIDNVCTIFLRMTLELVLKFYPQINAHFTEPRKHSSHSVRFLLILPMVMNRIHGYAMGFFFKRSFN